MAAAWISCLTPFELLKPVMNGGAKHHARLTALLGDASSKTKLSKVTLWLKPQVG